MTGKQVLPAPIAALAAIVASTILTLAPASYADDALQTAADDTAAAHRDMAKKATTDAAQLAIESVQADNKLDLDIRLIGPTSVTIANDR
jgi:nucleoid-associated protein YgaU